MSREFFFMMLRGLNMFNVVSLFMTLAGVVLFIMALGRIKSGGNSLARAERLTNGVLLCGVSSFVLVLIDTLGKLILAGKTIASSGTGDPRVIAGGIVQFFTVVFFHLLISTVVLLLWAVLKFIGERQNRMTPDIA